MLVRWSACALFRENPEELARSTPAAPASSLPIACGYAAPPTPPFRGKNCLC